LVRAHHTARLVDQFSADASTWQELADLHLSMNKYDSAAFCFEELILHDPMNHLLHCRLGEIYYTLGRESLPGARKHFSQSLEIKRKGNPRALHGLAACCHAIAEDTKLSKEAKGPSEVNAALHNYASTELRKLYSQHQQALVEPLGKVLQMQAAAIEETA
jgi:tetratricopeptide (TPR) repeat protein